jgi:hypothetical protein
MLSLKIAGNLISANTLNAEKDNIKRMEIKYLRILFILMNELVNLNSANYSERKVG